MASAATWETFPGKISASQFRQAYNSSVKANSSPIVFVVDGDGSAEASLESLIRNQGWQAESFGLARDFLDRPRTCVPHCLILAFSRADWNSVKLQKEIARERTDLPIIMICAQGDIPTTVEAMKAGAIDFLIKPFSPDVLFAAIRQGLERSSIALRCEIETRDLRTCFNSLTPRERQVMALVVAGLLNKQVGGELGISEITVKAHRGQVMQKMRANSLPDLVRMAARLNSEPFGSRIN
jgi:FixJ family two-component response regulator